MLTIRLSRHGRTKLPFYRIVLTEHSKPVKAGYQEVLGRYNPIKHLMEVDVPLVQKRISQGAKPSERLAKLLFAHTQDESFKAYFVERTRTAKTKKEEKK